VLLLDEPTKSSETLRALEDASLIAQESQPESWIANQVGDRPAYCSSLLGRRSLRGWLRRVSAAHADRDGVPRAEH
jgi:hypothetical protein